ncbi:hypothetical protein JX265_010786 [Neoarthrinium moseri]|uniref:Cytochrome b5 heme-binding domain-containing protein n=1 Tax=Neoarthrinium moseri TaxID=1658444 RepID=A0A9Q0AI04_9PEZI|nr:uncharacterized protein JN550_010648 [Neoarthrinium moseri]KAI1840218.1 hypothetical protein JX266_013585 [Neoarthrinium moseri]KAI1858118.1 hypothetical protein JX265_010786 [Neoarthrinium moseri]KAI1862017.1 hypothetical protein JN550_010648 [Neoarthrinium moseri]
MTALGLEEIQRHNTNDDIWIILHGVVYNVSKYLENHPGGPELLLEVAGQDATKFFEEALHSEDARDILPRLKVGNVEGYRRLDEVSDSILIVGAQAAAKRASPANVVILVAAPLVVATFLGYHGDELQSLRSALAQALTDAHPLWFSGVILLILCLAGLGTWASYIIYVDYGDLKKFPSHIRIE